MRSFGEAHSFSIQREGSTTFTCNFLYHLQSGMLRFAPESLFPSTALVTGIAFVQIPFLYRDSRPSEGSDRPRSKGNPERAGIRFKGEGHPQACRAHLFCCRCLRRPKMASLRLQSSP